MPNKTPQIFDWVVKRTERIYFTAPVCISERYLLLPSDGKSLDGGFKATPDEATRMTQDLAEYIAKNWLAPLTKHDHAGCGWETLSLKAIQVGERCQT